MQMVTGLTEPQGAVRAGASCRLLNPIHQRDWNTLLAHHPGATVFHTQGWAQVLHETYGHKPCYFCRVSRHSIEELLPIMEVSSRVTGRRGVSLPFSDSCPVLERRLLVTSEIQGDANGEDLGPQWPVAKAFDYGWRNQWRYLELRSDNYEIPGMVPSIEYYGHVIDLGARAEALYKSLASSVRRAIRKAQGGDVEVRMSTGWDAVESFFVLHCQTRRRHGLPPQPFRFFENIWLHLLKHGHGFIVLAKVQGKAVAAAMFLHFGRRAIYKFGASNPAFQALRPNDLLMWKAIEHCAGVGFDSLHLGRTSIANEGLRRFKLGFGAVEERITYYKYDFLKKNFVSDSDRAENSPWKALCIRMPIPVLRLAGAVLYPHLS